MLLGFVIKTTLQQYKNCNCDSNKGKLEHLGQNSIVAYPSPSSGDKVLRDPSNDPDCDKDDCTSKAYAIPDLSPSSYHWNDPEDLGSSPHKKQNLCVYPARVISGSVKLSGVDPYNSTLTYRLFGLPMVCRIPSSPAQKCRTALHICHLYCP